MCERSGHDHFQHGAIAFLKNKPISKGWNSNLAHGGLRKKYGQRSHHAETHCMRGVKKADSILIVRLSRGSKKLTMSKPCDPCMNFLRDKGIKKIYFSNWSGEIEEMRL